jgi:hypothetical protein
VGEILYPEKMAESGHSKIIGQSFLVTRLKHYIVPNQEELKSI